MRHKEFLARMERLRARLEEYAGPGVTWTSDDEGKIRVTLPRRDSWTSVVVGPLDPDELAEAGTDDAAHHVLMRTILARRAEIPPDRPDGVLPRGISMDGDLHVSLHASDPRSDAPSLEEDLVYTRYRQAAQPADPANSSNEEEP